MPKPLPPPLSFRLGHQEPAPYPTVQAITAPTASRSRGNWGLKRDVPDKITHTTMRVTELDTIERFMTFESANDDVLTLKKWQEIDLPLTKSPALVGELSVATRPLESVFDDNVSSGEGYKWKHLGPFLLDMPADEFKRYVLKKVKPRQKEFEAYVAKHMAEARGVYESAATANGEAEETEETEVNMVKLRADTMKFLSLVTDFLDIPRSGRPYRTHPSAGLHYTRSAAHIPHDPEHGPRPSRSAPGRSLNSGLPSAVVGIGGVAAALRDNTNYPDRVRIHNDRRQVRDYEPRSAYISTRGRIMMDARPAVSHEEAIGMRSRGPGTIWGIEDIGSVRDQLRGLVPPGGSGRVLEGWGGWPTNPGRQQGDSNGGGGGLKGLLAPMPRFSETFTKPNPARGNRKRENGKQGNGKRDSGEQDRSFDDILGNLVKK